jgi:hypothetical protein
LRVEAPLEIDRGVDKEYTPLLAFQYGHDSCLGSCQGLASTVNLGLRTWLNSVYSRYLVVSVLDALECLVDSML